MAELTPDKIRNIALVGHGGCGKTSLAEAMLFAAGAVTRLGSVDDGNATMDFDPDEVARKISISSSLAPAVWNGVKINILDTPGYADFFGETTAAMQVVDSVVIVVDAVGGLEVQTDKAWSIALERGLPRIIFINRMDKEHADYSSVLDSLTGSFGTAVAPVCLPIGKESSFEGFVDLVAMKAYTYDGGKRSEGDIPDDLAGEADALRDKLVESVAESDDALLERYLEGETLTQAEVEKAMLSAVAAGSVVPVLCGSAHTTVGIDRLMDAVLSYVPSPADVGPKTGTNPKNNEQVERACSTSGPLSALVFKTMADPYVGKLTYFRVYSGVLKADSSVYNASREEKERLGHVYEVKGKHQEDVKQVVAGDFGAAPKLGSTETGDTLCDESAPIVFEPITFPAPLVSIAVAPKTKADEDKLGGSLHKLAEEDPTLTIRRDSETHQTIVSGIGDVHLEVVMERLKRKFGVETEVSEPKIPYHETIRKPSKAQGRHKKQTGGHGQFGDCWVEIEPNPGAGFEFVDKIVGGAIPRQYIPAVEKGVIEAMNQGVVAGYPVVDIKATVYDGSFHSVDSSEMAFKIAGSLAFKKAAEGASPALLEPIVNLEVTVPEEFMGDVMGNLSGKRGKILGMEPRAKYQVVKASVPLAEVQHYSAELRSMTRGQGTFSMDIAHYEEVPPDMAKKVIEATAKEKEEQKS